MNVMGTVDGILERAYCCSSKVGPGGGWTRSEGWKDGRRSQHVKVRKAGYSEPPLWTLHMTKGTWKDWGLHCSLSSGQGLARASVRV